MKNISLLTDFYQLTMLEGYYRNNMIKRRAVFNMFYRRNPFNGGYAVFAGLERLIEYINDLHFREEDLEYLSSLGIFSEGLIQYLRDFRFQGSIHSFEEGGIVFPNEPLVRVEAELGQAQFIETALLNIINFQTLIATKASRVCFSAEGRPVIEFGLRRAQGADGGLSASRAAFIGGCMGTSNVLAGKMYDLPVKGTQAHSWIMSFNNELDSFMAYADVYPDSTILLVDTYNTIDSGVPNAVKTAEYLKGKGHSLLAVRLDSGDEIDLSKKCRTMLDKAGFKDVKILLSGDLDEHRIKKILTSGAPVDMFGVGTRLATGHVDASLSGVYKMAALEGEKGTAPRLKVSDDTEKGTLPGKKNVYRYYKKGKALCDLICLSDEEFPPINDVYTIAGNRASLPEYDLCEPMLKPVFIEGKQILTPPDVKNIQKNYFTQFEKIPGDIKQLNIPETYNVLLSHELHNLKNSLLISHGFPAF